MVKTLQYSLIALIALTVSFLAGKYTTKPQEKIVVQTEFKEVIKEVEVLKNVYIKETQKPDGTVIKETTDLSKIKSQENSKQIKQDLVKETSRPQWIFGGGVGYNLTDREQVYSAEANTRILNLPMYLGVQGIVSPNNNVGLLKIMVEF